MELDEDGETKRVLVAGQAAAQRLAAVKGLREPCAALSFWLEQSPQPLARYGSLGPGAAGNCTLSVGPLLPSEIAVVVARLHLLLA